MPSYPRRCPKCGVMTEEEGFGVDRSKTSGRKSHCKTCDRERAKAYYAEHRDELYARREAVREAAWQAHLKKLKQGTPTYSREACRTPLHLQREPTSSSAPLRGGPSLATSRARARSRNQRRAYRRERATHLRPSARRVTLTGIPTALNAEAHGGRSSIGAWPVCRLVWDAVTGVTAVAALVLSIIVGLSQRRRDARQVDVQERLALVEEPGSADGGTRASSIEGEQTLRGV
jgi:hypothetical protein